MGMLVLVVKMDSQVLKKLRRKLVRHHWKDQQQTDRHDTYGCRGPEASHVLCAARSPQLR